MREYFDMLHGEVCGPNGGHLWIFNVPDYSDGFLSRANGLFDRALTLAGDEGTRRRVLKARLPIEYDSLLRDSEFQLRDGGYAPADLDRVIPRARDLFSRMREFGIESIHEGQPLDGMRSDGRS